MLIMLGMLLTFLLINVRNMLMKSSAFVGFGSIECSDSSEEETFENAVIRLLMLGGDSLPILHLGSSTFAKTNYDT